MRAFYATLLLIIIYSNDQQIFAQQTNTIHKLDSLQRDSLPKTKVLDEVVITAGRRSEYISAIPSSITVLNNQDIAQQSQISNNLISILGNTVPGLATAGSRATNTGQTLRGRAVLVLIDGIPQSTPLMNGQRDFRTIDPSVIERVEVIKGATSIYGNGSAGGIINYITKSSGPGNPKLAGTTTLRGTIQPFSVKESGGYNLSQSLYGHHNKWSYLTSGSVEYIGVQKDGEGVVLGQSDALSNSYQINGLGKLRYAFNEETSLTAFYNFYSSTSHAKYINKDGVFGVSPAIGIEGKDPGKPTGTPFNHNAMLTFQKKNLFKNTQLEFIAYLNSFRSMNRYVNNSTAWYGPGQTKINSRKKGIRINLNSSFLIYNRDLDITYGLDILNDITNQNLTDGRVYIPYMNMFNLAPYMQVKMNIIDHLVFKGGVRYENASVKIDDFNTIATGPNGQGSIFVNGGEIPYHGTTFNAGLRYNKYHYFNPFISFSQGFAINELGRIVRRATDSDLKNIKTDPLITNNYEIGFSSQFTLFQLTAAYYISTSKLGVEMVDMGGYFMPQRLPEKIQGFEIALTVTPNEDLKLGGTFSSLEGKSKATDGTKTYLNQSRIAPPKATAFVQYQINNKLNAQISWINSGSRDRFVRNNAGNYRLNEGPVKAVDLFHLNLAYAVNKQWNIGLGVENLFNKTYFPVNSQAAANNATYSRGTGTVASLNLRYQF